MTSKRETTPSVTEEAPVHTEHPELHHYTNYAGLGGIITTNILWATRYDCLNDATEVIHFRDFLVSALSTRLFPKIRQHMRSSLRARLHLEKQGSPKKISNHEARNLVDALYRVTFEGGEDGVPFAVPYITSFCGHGRDHEYEQSNGLLSQWRAYGGQQSFAIVLDSKLLSDFLQIEWDEHLYSYLTFCDVIYNDHNLDFKVSFSGLLDSLTALWMKYSELDPATNQDAPFSEFVLSAARFKHRGFVEEREIRIVAAPMLQDLIDYLGAATGDASHDPKDLKEICVRKRGDAEVTYVTLLKGIDQHLPIKRIIVGPGPSQTENANKVKRLVGSRISVRMSETPFIG